MYCRNCGKEMKDGDRFCPNCGWTKTVHQNPNGASNQNVGKNESKIGAIQNKIGVLMLIAGIICMLAFVTAPSHRSEAFPVGCGLIAGGVVLLVLKQKK